MTKQTKQAMDCLESLSEHEFPDWHSHLWPPFTQIGSVAPPQKVIQAKGAHLIMENNSPPLIDAISSWWVTLHGHANPYIAKAIAKQALELEQVIFADFIHPQAEKLAARLSKKTGLKRVFFSDNGSTSVEVAIKMACQFWHNKNEQRNQIIAFEGAYHGDTFGAMAVGERNVFNAPFEQKLFPVTRVPWPATWWGDESIEAREKKVLSALEKHLETPTIAVIIEPLIQGAGGMAMVRKEFIKSLELITKQSGALLIADEVLTGFGRCGTLFAFQRAGIKPDLISLSKGLTGGFLPMGITMATEKIYAQFIGKNPRQTFWHGHSFTANPLGCAAANASLDLLERAPNLYKDFESRHLPYLEDLAKHPKVIKPRLIGTISAFNISVNGQSGYMNPVGKIIKESAMKCGVFIRPLGEVVYLLPPLCLNDKQLDNCYSAIKAGLSKV